MKFLKLLCIGLLFSFLGSLSLFAQSVDTNDFDKHRIRVKFKKEKRTTLKRQRDVQMRTLNQKKSGVSSVDVLNEKHLLKKMNQLFPVLRPSLQAKHEKYNIDLWYEIEIEDEVTEELIKEYKKNEAIEIAEPVYQMNLFSVLNDPQKSYHHDNIQTKAAWDIETGSDNVIVAVADSGVSYTHEDLAGAMWVNEAEANGVTGIDDDGNGHVDDIHGALVDGHGGSDPIAPGDHGTKVAGVLAAVSDNGIGISGVAGGSATKPGVRIMSSQFLNGGPYGTPLEALVYAADNGAVIANCSWGTVGSAVGGLAEAVEYFIETAGTDDYGNQIGPMKGGVVLGAAGNLGTTEKVYPAAYDNVIAVAETNINDVYVGSNYGPWVNISAPGNGIVTTDLNGGYATSGGSSMSTPIVAGVAALLVSKYQDQGITPEQVKEALLNSANNIDEINDADYIGQMGVGRVNAYAALNYGLGFNCDVIEEPYETIEAETFCGESGVQTNASNTYVGWIENDDWVNYAVDFGYDKVDAIEVSVASATNGGTIEIRQGSPIGTLVGSIPVDSTGSWNNFEQKTTTIAKLTGTQNLYFVFKGGSGYLFNIDWIKFPEIECEVHNAFSIIEPEDSCDADSRIIFSEFYDGVTVAGNLNEDTWVNYIIDFGTGVDSIEVDANNTGIGANLLIRLDSVTGPIIGSVVIDYSSSPEMQTYTGNFDKIEGVQNVYFTYSASRAGGSFYMGSFTFSSTTVQSFIPDPNKTYYIDSPYHNLRLASNGDIDDPYTTSTSTTGADVEWQFVKKENTEFWHIQRAAGGSIPRIRSNVSENAQMVPAHWNGTKTYYDFVEGHIADTHYITLPEGPEGYVRLQINRTGAVKMVDIDSEGTWESFKITEVQNSGAPIGQTIWLKSLGSGKYVQRNETSGRLDANASSEQDELVPFIIEDAEDGMVALKSVFNGQYVVADTQLSEEVAPLYANRGALGDWEKFTWINNPDGTISLKANVNAKYVCADNNLGGNWPLAANRDEDSFGHWEKFYWGTYSAAKELTAESSVVIYPNPVVSTTTINNAAGSTLNVYNMNGSVVFTTIISSESETIDLSKLAIGIYYTEVIGATESSIVKLVKN